MIKGLTVQLANTGPPIWSAVQRFSEAKNSIGCGVLSLPCLDPKKYGPFGPKNLGTLLSLSRNLIVRNCIYLRTKLLSETVQLGLANAQPVHKDENGPKLKRSFLCKIHL